MNFKDVFQYIKTVDSLKYHVSILHKYGDLIDNNAIESKPMSTWIKKGVYLFDKGDISNQELMFIARDIRLEDEQISVKFISWNPWSNCVKAYKLDYYRTESMEPSDNTTIRHLSIEEFLKYRNWDYLSRKDVSTRLKNMLASQPLLSSIKVKLCQ